MAENQERKPSQSSAQGLKRAVRLVEVVAGTRAYRAEQKGSPPLPESAQRDAAIASLHKWGIFELLNVTPRDVQRRTKQSGSQKSP